MTATKYNPEYHRDWAWSLYVLGATDKQVSEAFGVSERTILRWAKKFEDFRKVRETTKNLADSRVEKSLYKRAMGYEYTTTETDTVIDENGQPKIKSIRTYKNYEKPDVGAIAFWLKNRKPGDWRDRREPEIDADIMKKTDEILVKIQKVATTKTDEEPNNDKEEVTSFEEKEE